MALQMLYQQDLNPDMPADIVRELIVERLRDESLSRFAWQLFGGVMESRAALDAKIEEIAANWSLKRMAPTDRNVLRLAAFELQYTDTPPRVVIDEALELAKRYGTAQSSQFVNGILDRLIPGGGRKANEPTPPPAE
jgi:N utilization substance protein B